MELTTKLKLFKTIGLVKGPPREVTFTRNADRPRKLLFFFPVEKEMFVHSIHLLRRLERYPARNKFVLAILSDHRDTIATSSHKTFYYTMSAGHPERIDYEALVNKFGNKSFDAVINLEPGINLDMARVMSAIKAAKRIGFMGPGADDLYNIQIRCGSDTDYTLAYDQILAICDLGPETDHPDHHLWG